MKPNRKSYPVWVVIASLLALAFISNTVWADDGGDPVVQEHTDSASRLLVDILRQGEVSAQDHNELSAQIGEVIQLYDEAILLDRNDPTIHSQRAFALSYAQDITGAIDGYTQVIKLAPNSADAYKNRAINYERLGYLEASLHDFEVFAFMIKDTPSERRMWEREWVEEKILNLLSETNLERTPHSELIELPQLPSNGTPRPSDLPEPIFSPGVPEPKKTTELSSAAPYGPASPDYYVWLTFFGPGAEDYTARNNATNKKRLYAD